MTTNMFSHIKMKFFEYLKSSVLEYFKIDDALAHRQRTYHWLLRWWLRFRYLLSANINIGHTNVCRDLSVSDCVLCVLRPAVQSRRNSYFVSLSLGRLFIYLTVEMYIHICPLKYLFTKYLALNLIGYLIK